ncbi:NAD-dependent epimerase/dehydratase family protein [Streptomyces sp. NPDC058045]|uniref:NAD-dependent epimerase/dehydratase family protein n=1 Tax=Streptomyces sp. NPDC058045 TaxID=3346311 RepID=UPI0036EB5BDE
MTNALVIGAAGQLGRPAVAALAGDGWRVTAASRSGGRDPSWPEKVRTVRLDRDEDGPLDELLSDGFEVVVDLVAFDARHARQLLRHGDRIGSAVVVSSGAVYADGEGRSFDTQDEPDGFPAYPVPLPETQPTVAPGESTYGTRKVALERELVAAGRRLPSTLLRAGAVYGPHCRTPRELFFVKRNLDGRRRRVLAYGGESRFHPVSARNVAELIRLAAARPGTRILNAADPQAPTVAEIAAAIDAAMGVTAETVLVPGEPTAPPVGLTPWSTARPVVYDPSTAERELGYRPVATYREAVPETVAWLSGRLAEVPDWRRAFPTLARNYDTWFDLFDYAAEDAWLIDR